MSNRKPNPWTVAAVDYMIRAKRPMTIAEVYAAVPDGESEHMAGKRIYHAVANGYLTAEKSGAVSLFEATGKRHPDVGETGPKWERAIKCPRVASVFHLAQGVRW